MSRVAFVVEDFGAEKARAIAEIRSTSAVSLAELIVAAQRGTPVFERTLFDRKDREFPYRLLRMLQTLDTIGASYHAYELLEGQTFDAANSRGYFEITADRLNNMISTRAASLQAQREFGRREKGS